MPFNQEGFKHYLRDQQNASGEPRYSPATIKQYTSGVNRAAHHADVDIWSSSTVKIESLVSEFDTNGKYEEIGAQSNRMVINALKRLLEYSRTNHINETSYLLTWNPKKFHVGGDSGVQQGKTQRWSCQSQQPKIDDNVYLMRLGEKPKGIVAYGKVVRESYKDTDWGDSSKTRSYIDFIPEFVAEDAAEDSSQVLVDINKLTSIASQVGADFNWSHQSSGIRIPDTLAQLLTEELTTQLDDSAPQMTKLNQEEHLPLNQILFGPPGTGKTYQTIEASVHAAEPTFNWSTRAQLKEKYKELIDVGRIRFVTFHQSFSYEDFVEGLTAHTDNGSLLYEKRLGIFRQIVKAAKEYQVTEIKTATYLFDKCWETFLNQLEDEPEGIQIKTKRKHFTVTEVDGNTIRFDKRDGSSTHSLSVTTLDAVFNGEREIKGGLQPYYESLIRHLEKIGSKLTNKRIERQNYVLVIDEINRGNISRIFGELITLIEPSKRTGAAESLEVTLPLTGDKFSVPDNLYLIGTMNTADRSLAGLDLALRRRFDFIEMPPQPALLSGQFVEGVDLQQLLDTINRRITALLDKDHCIGHAYFMHLATKNRNETWALNDLAMVFRQKIIPLLQEYFFEDWLRIRWVLNDQNKEQTNAFIVKDLSVDFDELFPNTEQLHQNDTWCLNEDALERPEAYKQIYLGKVTT